MHHRNRTNLKDFLKQQTWYGRGYYLVRRKHADLYSVYPRSLKRWQDWVKRELHDDEMRHLTPEMVGPLYKARYWDAIHGDELPSGLDLCVFDCAVNCGVSRAVRFLQHSVGAVEDEVMGPDTLARVTKSLPNKLIADFCAQREMFYKGLPTFGDFGKGWMARLDRVEDEAREMAHA
jgi:lysozyme family protein